MLKDKIFEANDFITEKVNVPEWGVTVYIKTLNGDEREEYESYCVSLRRGKTIDMIKKHIRATFLTYVLCDDKGQLIFDRSDAAKLSQEKSGKVLDRLYTIGSKLNGLSPEDVEAMAKNSESAPDEDSISV